MKKLILLILLIPSLLFAGPLQQAHKKVIAGQTVAVEGGCDSCSGDLVFSAHFEDTTGNDIEEGTPCGCTDGSDTTITLNDASYTTTSAYVADGATAILASGENYYVSVDNTDLPSGAATTGTFCVDYTKITANTATIAFLGSDWYFEVLDGAGSDDNTLRCRYGGTYYAGTDTFADSTRTRICFSWDESPADNSEKIATKVGENSWQSSEVLNVTPSTYASPVYIVSGSWQDTRGAVDNVKLYSSYQAE